MRSRKTVPAVWRMILSGFCASLVGIGLSRFAYTPLLPELVAAHWFAAAGAVYLGAANLAGYLAGALFAQPAARRLSAVAVLRAMMVLATLAFFACAAPRSFAWFFLWRFAAGVAGGAMMVLAAPTVLPHVPAARRGLAGGAIFVGVGCGIVVSAALMPLLLRWGLSAAWYGLGGLSLGLSLVAWNGWPRADAPPPQAPRDAAGLVSIPALPAIYLAYALNAVGLVPHMIFLVDFVARGLGRGTAIGTEYWLLFGLGAMVGPVVAGSIADRIGFARALRHAFWVQAVAVVLPVLASGPLSLAVSSIVVGAFVPGIAVLVLGRIHGLIQNDAGRQKAAWSVCTTAFALGQAGGAYALSYLFLATGGGYGAIFILGAACLAAAFAIDLVFL